MKKTILTSLILVVIGISSCKKDKNCKECSGCKTLPTRTLCEDEFEKASDYNDQVQNYQSDGCNCQSK